MEVATIITHHKKVNETFDEFLHQFSSLSLYGKDDNTQFFESANDKKYQLYYHFEFNDPEYELSYNYSDLEIEQIKRDYGTNFYMFDVSYNPEKLLANVLRAFVSYLEVHDKELLSDISIIHPFNGLIKLEKF